MKVIATTKAPAAIGPYSQGYEVNGFVFSSGQIPVNPETVFSSHRHKKPHPECRASLHKNFMGSRSIRISTTARKAGMTRVTKFSMKTSG